MRCDEDGLACSLLLATNVELSGVTVGLASSWDDIKPRRDDHGAAFASSLAAHLRVPAHQVEVHATSCLCKRPYLAACHANCPRLAANCVASGV